MIGRQVPTFVSSEPTELVRKSRTHQMARHPTAGHRIRIVAAQTFSVLALEPRRSLDLIQRVENDPQIRVHR